MYLMCKIYLIIVHKTNLVCLSAHTSLKNVIMPYRHCVTSEKPQTIPVVLATDPSSLKLVIGYIMHCCHI